MPVPRRVAARVAGAPLWRARTASSSRPCFFFHDFLLEQRMSDIKRIHTGKRMSGVVIHNGVAYLAGQVAGDATQDVEGQTAQVLATIEGLLAEAGTDKSRILSAQVFLANMSEFQGMNKTWDAWVASGNAPARATIEARLASPDLKVEIMVVAAVG
jgi:enamine deaminase RidA (YjgF/YER057c/UK114 family)